MLGVRSLQMEGRVAQNESGIQIVVTDPLARRSHLYDQTTGGAREEG